jgi:hypothetical protein
MKQVMKTFLKLLFAGILIYMIGMTTWVSLHKSIMASGDEFGWKTSPWAVATLFDAYFGFVTFYVWVAYKERRWPARIVWFFLVMGLGNIAMSTYMLIQLFRLKPEQPLSALLLREAE